MLLGHLHAGDIRLQVRALGLLLFGRLHIAIELAVSEFAELTLRENVGGYRVVASIFINLALVLAYLVTSK